MYQRDYILRMIEMIADLIAGILGLIKKGDFDKAEESIDQVYYQMLKEDSSFFSAIPIENLTAKLLNEHNYTNGHLEILSELFYSQAELYYAKGEKAESKEFYQKTLKLLEYVIEETETFSMDKQSRIGYLKDRIKG